MEYRVKVEVTMFRVVTVEADSAMEAEDIARDYADEWDDMEVDKIESRVRYTPQQKETLMGVPLDQLLRCVQPHLLPLDLECIKRDAGRSERTAKSRLIGMMEDLVDFGTIISHAIQE